MKHIFILLILFPVMTFSQEITDIKDDFTGERKITYEHKSFCRPLIDNTESFSQFFLLIKEVRQVDNSFIMEVNIPVSTFNFTRDGFLWILFEDGTKEKCSIEIYNEIIVFPEKTSYGYNQSVLDFYISLDLITKLSEGEQIKSIRFMTQDGYVDYKHTGFKSKTKDDRRKKDVVEYFTGIKNYYLKTQE